MMTSDRPPDRVRRADARRSIAAILDAATRSLARDPEVSTAEIAASAGVGRITVYGHFKNRADLIEAVLVRAVDHADAAIAEVDLSRDPVDALVRLTRSSWVILDQFRGVLHASRKELSAERIRAAHDRVVRHLRIVIERGQKNGSFRSDLRAEWLVATAVGLMHTAAEEVEADRLSEKDAADYVAATLIAALTSPGREVSAE